MSGPARSMTPALGGDHEVPVPDPVARDYLLLALRLDQRTPGLVDGYFGPADLKARVDMELLAAPGRLVDDARTLRARLPAEVEDPGRRRWLEVQLVALETQALALAGEAIEYVEFVQRCFDVRPAPRDETVFATVAARLAEVLPGGGPLEARLAAWDERMTIPTERVRLVAEWLIGRFRERAAAEFDLPEGESLRLDLVRQQPWSGYNWYAGGLRSRVELNVDLPIRATDLVHVLAHETYPGHHLEHAWKEAGLVLDQGRLESSILLINTPECLLSEGLADVGYRFACPPDEEHGLLGELFERAGLAAAGGSTSAAEVAGTAARVAALRRELSAVAVNAALMRHASGASHEETLAYLVEVGLMSPERAAKRLSFIEHPLWRTYVFVYTEGEALLRRWLDRVPPAQRTARFGRLLREAATPSGIAAELDASR